jgi:flagellar biosynthetic protein FliQ
MTIDQTVDIAREAITVALMIAGPILVAAIVMSLLVSLAQALTSIQDQTISIVPRLIVVTLTFLFTLPWILQRMTEYSRDVILRIAGG